MKFNVLVNDAKIREAAQLVSFHCVDTEFLQLVQSQEKFNHTNLTPKEVALKLTQMRNLEVTVSSYTPKWPWSKAVAYVDYRKNIIFFNSRRDFPVADRVETLMHEAGGHLMGFSHRGNRVNKYNLGTVPYKIASIFIKYIKSKGII